MITTLHIYPSSTFVTRRLIRMDCQKMKLPRQHARMVETSALDMIRSGVSPARALSETRKQVREQAAKAVSPGAV